MSVIIKIQGGLGNQMFQYAFGKALSLRNKTKLKLDINEYKNYFRTFELEIFDIEKNYANINEIPFYERRKINNRYFSYIDNIYIRPFFRKRNKNHHFETEGVFENKFLDLKTGYFEGYFQKEDYFKDFENEIRKTFTFKNKLGKKNNELLKYLKGKTSVSIHIRRGDYLNLPDFYPICPISYYEKSIKYIYRKERNPIFLFFSDDQERVKKMFKGDNYIYVDWNTKENSWQDMALMSECNHNIIANSSFSRRGARLNNNQNKIVIAPKLRTHKKTYGFDCVPQNRMKL